jgi:tRNA(fMet)-specific endonuclease VapC
VEVKILLDTSAYVAFKLNKRAVVDAVVNAGHVFFSCVVLGELMFGFRNGARFKKSTDDLGLFLRDEAVELVPVGEVTADRYARIASQLRQQGTPIPTNDIWIAAQTMEHGAELLTTDAHFNNIPGLVCTVFR